MFDFIISEKEKAWVKAIYPDISLNQENDSLYLQGSFEFEMVYDEKGYINPCPRNYPDFLNTYKGVNIRDTYAIKIVLQRQDNSLLPQVFEIEGRIENMARKKQLSLADLHISNDDSNAKTQAKT